MVRTTKSEIVVGEVRYVEFSGLSTDDKPVGDYSTGSLFLEVDTCDVYFYDEDTSEWLKVGGE